MIRRTPVIVAVGAVLCAVVVTAQTRVVPRPPAGPPGFPAGESAAPDGYQPIPQWLGQTHASVPTKTETFTVETVVGGLNGANFRFLPDGRIILAESDGKIRLVGKNGSLSDPLAGMPADM